jgi:dihydroneopterin aldolase/2-amino-4-hydroxy-6-hydroxymethyldihydropteridine diphosphokinase
VGDLVRILAAVAEVAMDDRIEINGLTVTTVVGALPHEREIAQPLRIDLALLVDLHDAGRSDELGDTVHYGEVAEQVAAVARENKDVLLERLADRIAEVAVAFDRVSGVELTVTKLRPPIAEHVDTTAVRVRRTRADFDLAPRASHRAIVALGSNLGDRWQYLARAVDELGDVVAMSQVYETDPVGGPDRQGAYLNMVVAVDTPLDPFAFVRRCQRIEAAALRQRTVHWGPRTLDVDVLLYDDVTIDSPELTIPHPRYAERRFVLAPLAEVAPQRCPEGWDEALPPAGVHARGPLIR